MVTFCFTIIVIMNVNNVNKEESLFVSMKLNSKLHPNREEVFMSIFTNLNNLLKLNSFLKMNWPIKYKSLFFAFFFLYISNSYSQTATPSNVPAHKLVLFENEHFIDWTFQELKSKIKTDLDLIDLNRCNKSEFELIPQLKKSNAKKNSLKILNSTTQKYLTYIDGSLYDEKMNIVSIAKISDNYVNDIFKILKTLRTIPVGLKLVNQIQQSLYTVNLVQTGGPRFEAISETGARYSGFEEASAIQHFVTLRRTSEEGIPFTRIGTGGNLRFDPSANFSNTESDSVVRTTLPVVTFSHELFHAFDSVRGLLDRRFTEGPTMEFIETTEYRATYFENQIRKGLGRKYRKYYGSVNNTTQSLLDSKGEPYLLPSPCLQ